MVVEMKDPLTPQERSERMSLVRSKDTKPETYGATARALTRIQISTSG